MTEALFLAELDDPQVGDEITLSGDEGRHAVAVRRVRTDEVILIANGAGVAVRGPVLSTDKSSLVMRADDVLRTPTSPRRWVVAQALAKGDRAELAVEVMTEMGVDVIIPWQASRSIVKVGPDRAERLLTRWRSSAREAVKQSRRFRVPVITAPMTTKELVLAMADSPLTLVLHESATEPLTQVEIPAEGDILCIVGPEGGISSEELDAFVAAGAVPVSLSDGVLRTSTAGVVALAQMQALSARTDA